MTVRHALDDNSFKLLVECRKFADAHLPEPNRSRHLREVLKRFEYGGTIIDQKTVAAMGLQEEEAAKKAPPTPPRTETSARSPATPAPTTPQQPTANDESDYVIINGLVCARDGARLKVKPQPLARHPETTPVPLVADQKPKRAKRTDTAMQAACERLLDAARHRPDFPADQGTIAARDAKTATYAAYDQMIAAEYLRPRGETDE